MSLSVIIDDAIVQTRAVLYDQDGPLRIALSGLVEGPVAGAVLPARLTRRVAGHGDCLVTLEGGHEAHLSARRGGADKALSEGASFMAQVVRAGDRDKCAEVRRVGDDMDQQDEWDEIDYFLSTLPERFDGDIRIAAPKLWAQHVPQWQARHPRVKDAFRQDFQAAGQLFDACAADDVLNAIMAGEWPLTGGGNVRFGSVSGISVFDVNSAAPAGPKGALSTNIAAARLLPRLVSLGGFGGLMVIDFIDLKRHSDQRLVLEAFDGACHALNLPIKRTGWSKFGMVEVQCASDGSNLYGRLAGAGAAAYHAANIAMHALSEAQGRPPGPIHLRVSMKVLKWLQAHKAQQRLSARLAMPVTLVGDATYALDAWTVETAAV